VIPTDTPSKRGRGRPPGLTREQVEQIIQQRRTGFSLMQIAISLNARGVPMPGGGLRWGKSDVKRVLSTRYAQEIAADIPT
jgi:hypothetical protein